MLIEVITVDDGVFGWPFLPTLQLNLMITQIIAILIARNTTIATSPTSGVRRGISILPNEVYVGGTLVGTCTEVLVMVVGTTTVLSLLMWFHWVF